MTITKNYIMDYKMILVFCINNLSARSEDSLERGANVLIWICNLGKAKLFGV